MTVYLYITERCEPGWSINPPVSLGNLVEAELRDGMVHITKCVVPRMAPRRRLSAFVFLRDFTPEKVGAACTVAAREAILAQLQPEASVTQASLKPSLDAYGPVFGYAALHGLTVDGEIQVHAKDETSHLWVTRNLHPVPNPCITPSGRTDCHSSYIQAAPGTRQCVCVFCGNL